MNRYKVLLNGHNFWVCLDGQPKLMGFYTTRSIQAETPERAEDLAIQLIRKDVELQETIINDKDDPPMIYAEEVIMVNSFEGSKPPDAGYFLYEDEDRGKV